MLDAPIVLIVDDNPGDIDLARLALEDIAVPAEVRCAYDGREAKEALERLSPAEAERFRLILLDLNMPRMNGREFLHWIGAHPTLRRIAVVVLTSSTVPTERDECLALGARDFWVKPARFDQLTARFAGVLPYL